MRRLSQFRDRPDEAKKNATQRFALITSTLFALSGLWHLGLHSDRSKRSLLYPKTQVIRFG